MTLSIVSTLFGSAPHVEEFCRRAGAAALQLVGDDHEIVLVNDGSPDDSLAIAVALCESNPHIVVVDLSRNFGHHKAMMTGMAHARGDQVFLIDSDLEEDPELLLSFSGQLQRENCDVVYGVQTQRKGGWFERITGQWYYRAFRLLTGLTLPENMVTARLMTRRYVDALLLHEERELDIGGLWLITGFEQRPQPVTKHATSTTTYTLRRKLSLFVNTITSFTSKPLVYIFYTGLLISFLAGLGSLFLVVQRIFLDKPTDGWTSVMASIWLLGGWIILFIGIIGIYLSRMFSEIKRRPYTIVRGIHRGTTP